MKLSEIKRKRGGEKATESVKLRPSTYIAVHEYNKEYGPFMDIDSMIADAIRVATQCRKARKTD